MTISEYFTPKEEIFMGRDRSDVEVEYEYNEEDPAADNQLEKAIEIVKGNGM